MTSKLHLRLYDANFVGSNSSSLYYDSERICWEREGPDTAVTVYTDHFLIERDRNPNVTNVGWLLEPPSISPSLYDQAERVAGCYDLILTHNADLIDRHPEKFVFYPNGMSWVAPDDWREHGKTQYISIIASGKNSAPGHALRHEVVREAVNRRLPLKVFGRGYHPVDHKVEALAPYRFSVSIENCSTRWYFTEKLIDCFATLTVPIYWGCPDIERFFDPTGVIAVTSAAEIMGVLERLAQPVAAEAIYQSMLPALMRNQELAKRYRVAEDWIFDHVLVPRGMAGERYKADSVVYVPAGNVPAVTATDDGSVKVKIVVPAYNAEKWIERCLKSIESQHFRNFECIVIDDASTDKTFDVLTGLDLDERFWVMRNPVNVGPLGNTWTGFERLGCHSGDPNDILTIVDGDDWLAHDKALDVVVSEYQRNPSLLMTYGNYANDSSPGQGRCDPIPDYVAKARLFRDYNCVISCLRTFRAKLWNGLKLEDMVDESTGKFYAAGGDVAYLLPLLDMAGTRFKFIEDIIYIYNTGNPLSDWRIRSHVQTSVDAHVRSLPRYPLFQE